MYETYRSSYRLDTEALLIPMVVGWVGSDICWVGLSWVVKSSFICVPGMQSLAYPGQAVFLLFICCIVNMLFVRGTVRAES